ncbi:MAG: short-chain dehydrogenase [Bacillaceae bacterium]|nr:short-chain dehydrogenase [Bacillaceae bacterium]
MKKKHALVVGGTGMLSDVTLWLHKKGYQVSVIGRRKERYHQLMERADHPDRISSILVDYHHTEELQGKLTEAVEKHGSFDLIIAWVHSSAEGVIPAIMNVQKNKGRRKTFDLFQVKPCNAYFENKIPEVLPECRYHEIFLGFKVVGGHSRWLTHREISEGVMDSVHHKRRQTIVGQVEPRDLQP